MSCRLPAAVHVPLNSCHSESSEIDSACAGDAAPSPASISATKRRDDLCQPSLQRCHAAARRLRPLTIIRHPHQSAAKRDIFRLPMYSERNTCTGSKSHLDLDQLRPDAEYTAAIGTLPPACPAGIPDFASPFNRISDAIQRIGATRKLRRLLAREDVCGGSISEVAANPHHVRSSLRSRHRLARSARPFRAMCGHSTSPSN